MSDQDPEFTQTTRTTVVEPAPRASPFTEAVETRETTVVDRRPSNTAWAVAGLVAVVAIIGVVWMVLAANGRATTDPEAVQDAIADARLEGQLEGAQASLAGAAAAADRAAESAARSAAEAVREPPVVVVQQPAPPSPRPAEDVGMVIETPPAG